MTAPLPPLPLTDRTLAMPATDYDPEWISSMEGYSEDDMSEYAKLAVREALERAAQMIERAQVRMKLPGQQAFCIYDANMAEEVRAMLKEYSDD
jgi:hypothetical protein